MSSIQQNTGVTFERKSGVTLHRKIGGSLERKTGVTFSGISNFCLQLPENGAGIFNP